MRKFLMGLAAFRLIGVTSAVTSSAASAVADEVIDYRYDALGRLIKVERSGTVNNNVDTDYEYDAANNRTRVKTTGSANYPPP